MPREYDGPTGDPNLGDESTQDLNALQQHIGEWWSDGMVWHELVSEYVHIDLHMIPPTKERPYHTLISTGMSDRAMQAPEEHADCKHCELLLSLPPEWPMEQKYFEDERNWWPFRHLKQTARFPHVYTTWLWFSHTVGCNNPLTPVADGVPFVGFAIGTPRLPLAGALKCHIRKGKEVHFFSLIPLYEAELKFAWEHGTATLFEKLDAAGVTELVDVTRACVITGKRPAPTSAPPAKPSWLQRILRRFRR